MAVKYDEKVLQEFAEKLYAKALNVVLKCWFTTYFVAFVAIEIWEFSNAHGKSPGIEPGLILGFIVSIFGVAFGLSRSLRFKLEAQQILCQAEQVKLLREIRDGNIAKHSGDELQRCP